MKGYNPVECNTFELYDRAIAAYMAQYPDMILGEDAPALTFYAKNGKASLDPTHGVENTAAQCHDWV